MALLSSRPNNSTIGRSLKLEAPRVMRAGMALLSAASPRAAAALAERLFLTPPRKRRRGAASTSSALEKAEPFVVDAAGIPVRAWRIGEGPAVLLVHGWGGRGDQLLPLSAPLLSEGCSIVTFDAPAHGSSPGRIASVVHFAAAIEAVAARTASRAVIAHSMGAAATALAISRGLILDAAVFLGPARSPEPFFERFCEALGLEQGIAFATLRRIESRVGTRTEDLDVARVARSARVPLLVVHDRDDHEVPWFEGAAIAAAWPGARLSVSSGLGHRRLLRDPAIRREATGFVLGRLTRCACGRLAVAPGGSCTGCSLADDLYHRETRWAAPAARA